MTSTGFENYAEALKIYLAKYREVSSSALCLCSLIPFSLSILLFRILVVDINVLTAVYSPNRNEERHSRRDQAVATALKPRSRVRPVPAQLDNRIHQAQRRIKDKKRVSTTFSVLMDPIPHSN